jgi:hypothetical protein
MTGACHHTQHFSFVMGSWELFCLGWPRTMGLLISVSQVARITGVSCQYLARMIFFFNTIFWWENLNREKYRFLVLQNKLYISLFSFLALWNKIVSILELKLYCVCLSFAELRVVPRALSTVGKHSTTELHLLLSSLSDALVILNFVQHWSESGWSLLKRLCSWNTRQSL